MTIINDNEKKCETLPQLFSLNVQRLNRYLQDNYFFNFVRILNGNTKRNDNFSKMLFSGKF